MSVRMTRRALLKTAVVGGAALGAPWVWRKADAQAKRLVIRDSGGPFTPAFDLAFYKPFREATGIEAVGVASAHEPTSQIKSMVDTKTYTWDLAQLSQAAADQLVQEGNYLEKHELEKHPDVAEIPPEYMTPYCVGDDVYSTILSYRTDAFKGRKVPVTWADLWDTKGVAGRRSLRKHPFDTLEEALLADGVPKSKLYPLDIERAFKVLDRIKKDVAVWWTGGAQTSQMLKTGEIDMAPTWAARAQVVIDEGGPVKISWDQNLWGMEGWCILKGGPKADLAREFIKFASNAKRMAAFAPFIANGPCNPNAYKYIDPKRAQVLTTYAENRASGIKLDHQFWAANKDKVTERFNAWLIA
jgi:putative spermidine/putrescine transport system substrate-binding protein